MPGNYQSHLDRFGVCTCGNPSGKVEMMRLESQGDFGRWTVSEYPACADCYGLL